MPMNVSRDPDQRDILYCPKHAQHHYSIAASNLRIIYLIIKRMHTTSVKPAVLLNHEKSADGTYNIVLIRLQMKPLFHYLHCGAINDGNC